MEVAINEAKKSSEKLKCGVVVAKNDKILTKAHNTQRKDNNPSAHAEINALKKASRLVGNKNLDDCEIYCTHEPCIMCLAAIAFAKVKKIFYGVDLRDVSPKNKLIDIPLNIFLKSVPYKIGVVSNFMEKECKVINK